MNKKEFIEKLKSKIEQIDEYGAMGIRQDSLLDLEEWVDLLLQAEHKCQSCEKPLSRNCPKCKRMLES